MEAENSTNPSSSNLIDPPQKGILALGRVWMLGLLALSIVAVIGVFFYLLFSKVSQGHRDYYPSSFVERISFSLPAGSVEFLPWERDYISFVYDFGNPAFSYKQIVIKEEESNRRWSLSWERDITLSELSGRPLPAFQVYIPANKYRNLVFFVNYGKVAIGALDNWHMEGFLTTGDIILQKLTNVTGELEVAWGSVETSQPIGNKFWQNSTGFEGLLETGSPQDLMLRVHMGSLRGAVH